MEPFLTIRPLCGFAAADPTVPRRLSDFLARKRHAHRPFSLRVSNPLPLPLLLANARMMDRCRVERVTNGRLPRQVVPLKNPLERFNRGGDVLVATEWARETAPNEGSSLVGSAANCVVLFGSNARLCRMHKKSQEKERRGKVKSRSTSFFLCVCRNVQYPWCLQKKGKNVLSPSPVKICRSLMKLKGSRSKRSWHVRCGGQFEKVI